ncbi:MAG: hypothetical protein RRZ83_01450 [Alistipes sp.]
MRRLTIILCVILLSWCCGAKASVAEPCHTTTCSAQIGIDASTSNELRCEREYNSDLHLPRPLAEMEPVRTLSLRLLSNPERMGVKCGIPVGREGCNVDCLPEFTHNVLLAGGDAVDYYIYRLRRLLI